MQTIYLDISNKGVVPTIYAKQGDVGRKFLAVFTDAGVPYLPPSGSVFSAWYSGKSGSGNYTDIGADSAFFVNDNSVVVEMISQMLQIPGDGILCVVLSKSNGDQIGMWNIPYFCEEVPGYGSDAAEDYFTAFSQAVQNLPYPDSSLSLVGKAAEAAAVGAALAGKAPTGYGLGTTGQITSDWNATVKSGFFYGNTNSPDGQWWNGIVSAESANYCTQFLFKSEANNICIRHMKNGTWGEWEWENPPMVVGVEYPTTERRKGKVVYTKVIDCGYLPSASTKTIATNVPAKNIIRSSLIITDGTGYTYGLPLFYGNGSLAATYVFIASELQISTTDSTLTNMYAVAQIWYIK